MKDILPNIGYSFKDSSLIELALTHKSFSSSNNERLEFLGDALINLYISERLFKSYDGLDEGKLTRFKASMVSRDNLNLIASKLNIGSLIKLGRGERLEGNSILGNTFEALIGAVFLDSDYSTTQIVLDNFFDDDFINIDEVDELKDPKSKLQEIIQKNYHSLPKYSVKEISNGSIAAKFEATCSVKEANLKSKGQGKTRKRSELEAAAKMLQLLRNNAS
tara:strand:- start:4203 stop:4862 length:660 start_codon:yes stop_codon:yes gene_type:complete